MNLLLLLAAARVWRGSPVEMVTRLWLAVSLFSLEMQLATWTGAATLRSLTVVNAAILAVVAVRERIQQRRHPPGPVQREAGYRPPAAVLVMALLALLLNLRLPLTAADPYHLERANRIAAAGTLAYDIGADSKLNVLGWLYELLLADLTLVPAVGGFLPMLHGVFGVGLFVLAAAAALQLLGVRSRLAWLLLLTVPVVFHQFVLVKNDLFGAVPALVALAWLATRAPGAPPVEVGWAAWLSGIAVGMKLTSFPLAIVAAAALLFERRREAAVLAAGAAGALVGLISGGLFFTLVENARVYGDAMAPLGALGNRNAGAGEALVSVWRFAISLFDLGLITRELWPGRGGWGGTYGLPLIWALAVLLIARAQPLARRVLVMAGAYWLAFAAVYPDADVAHRLAIAPGILVIAAAAATLEQREDGMAPALGRAGVAAAGVSALQIARSAMLYLTRL